jgi:hypothetical protein
MAYGLASAGNIFPTGSTSPTTAYSGTFIPEIWSGKLIEKFYDATVLGAIANTDYEGEIKNQGDAVKIRQRPDVTIQDYQANQELLWERPSADVVDLLIDKGKYFNVALDDVMEVQSDIDQLSIWAEDAAEQMKITIDTDVLNYLSDGAGFTDVAATNKGNTAGVISGDLRLGTGAAPTFVAAQELSTGVGDLITTSMAIIDYIVNAGQVLDEANIPEAGRWMVIPAWLASRIKKSDLKDASLAGDGTSILRNGRLGMIDRYTLYISNLLLPQTGTPTAYPILFGTTAAFTFAAQFTKMETIRSERTFSNLLRGLQVYGHKVTNGVAMGVGHVAKGS